MDKKFDTLEKAHAEITRLTRILNSPLYENFLEGVQREAAHQVERWGSVEDRAKEPQDWFWLVGYLSGKALRAHIDGKKEKAQHHTISTAAALLHWHNYISGDADRFTPGDSDLQKFLEQKFGPELEARKDLRIMWRMRHQVASFMVRYLEFLKRGTWGGPFADYESLSAALLYARSCWKVHLAPWAGIEYPPVA